MQLFKTVLGDLPEDNVGITLPHEHICCYSEYLYRMAGSKYLDKEKLIADSVSCLKLLKNRHSLHTFIDCTPINLGRDVELLRRISEMSGVNIICSTGLYYHEEPLICSLPIEELGEFIISDAQRVNAGVIKCAVEKESISDYCKRILIASARAQLELNLPIILHTNAGNRNGVAALEILMCEGVKPQAVTVAHLSDTEDVEYMKAFAEKGCYIGLDRLYGSYSDEYINKKLHAVTSLFNSGYGNKILLSHDALFFNGFDSHPEINTAPRFNYCFDQILHRLPMELVKTITVDNPVNMLKCK